MIMSREHNCQGVKKSTSMCGENTLVLLFVCEERADIDEFAVLTLDWDVKRGYIVFVSS